MRPERIAGWLAALASLIVAGSVLGQAIKYGTGRSFVYGLVPLLYVDSETSVPTFFSAALLLLSALALAVIAYLKRQQRAAHSRHWLILCLTFLYLALDESAGVHELLERPMRQLLAESASGWLHIYWVVPGLVAAAAFATFSVPLFVQLPRQTRRQVALATMLFLGGALGVEVIGGQYAARHGSTNFGYSLIATLEESLELAGAILFLHTWLTYLQSEFGAIDFRLREPMGRGDAALAETRPDLPLLPRRRAGRRTMIPVSSQ